MRVQSMTRAKPPARTFQWPAPPFFVRGESAANAGARPCSVEYLDGTLVEGNLVAFSPGDGGVAIRPGATGEVQALDLASVRVIRRTDPVDLRPDKMALQGVGASERTVSDDKSFEVKFADGAVMTGRTRGWVKDHSGLFLFVIAAEGALPVRHFIPMRALGDARIGPLLGEALATSKIISDKTLTVALERQAALRSEPLGELLHRSALVTREDLEKALRRQKRKPNIRLGQLLLESGLITAEQRDAALAAQAENRGRPLGEILIDIGAATRAQVQTALADKLGIPVVNVRDFKIEGAQAEGTLSLRQDAIEKVLEGTLDLASARAAYY